MESSLFRKSVPSEFAGRKRWPVIVTAAVCAVLGAILGERLTRPTDLPPRGEPRRTPEPAESASEAQRSLPDAIASSPAATEQLIAEGRHVADRLVEAFPDNPQALTLGGHIYFTLGHSAKAIEWWERSVELNPDLAEAWSGLAQAHWEQGDFDSAVTCMQRVNETDPRLAGERIYLMVDSLMGLGRESEAAAILRDRAKANTLSPHGLLVLGQAYLQAKDYEKAKRQFEAALAIEPRFAHAHYGLARALARLGDSEKAQHHRQEYARLKNQDLVVMDRMRGERREVEKVDPARVRGLVSGFFLNAGKIYATYGSWDQAEKHWLQAIGINPEFPEPRQLLHSLYSSQGRAQELEDSSRIEALTDRAPEDGKGKRVSRDTSRTGAEGPIFLEDVTAQTGITFCHTDGSSGRHYIVESVASGMATFDYDNDGLVDVYFLNGRPLPDAETQQQPANSLYRNVGGFRFVEVTGESGVGCTGYGMGVAIGDYDNDGRADIYVNNFGPNVLYCNNGDGTFRDVTRRAGVASGDTAGAGANFLDVDGDGDLDLFSANYIRFTYENHVTAVVRGASKYANPRSFPLQPNSLFRNNGNGTFTDVTGESGIGAHAGSGMGTVCLDYDNDGRTDIFVCNDQSWDFLFHNDGGGTFREVGLAAGASCNYAGELVSSMGADAGDYDNDGWLDLFLTDYEGERPILYRNLGCGMFEDLAMRAGVTQGSMALVKWGCAFVDFDNDGYKDIFVGCGHLQDDIEEYTDRSTYMVRPVLFRNLGNGTFRDVSETSGDGMKVKLVARGVAFDDLDNDGRVDVVVSNTRRPPTILRNQSVTGNHWIQIRLRGVKTNRDGVGAQVKVVAGKLVQTDEVHSGRGYQSHFGSRLHFGLGKRGVVDRIEVRWIGGCEDVFENVKADRLVTLVEGMRMTVRTLGSRTSNFNSVVTRSKLCETFPQN